MKTIKDVMDITIDNMELSVRGTNGLKGAGMKTLSDITARSLADLYSIRNMGKKTVDEISSKITGIGLSFNMTDRDWLNWGLAHIQWIKEHDPSL